MISRIKFKNIIIFSVFLVYFVSSIFLFFLYVKFHNNSIVENVYSENLFSARVANDFISKERENVSNAASRIGANKTLFIALKNKYFLQINKYAADKDPVAKLPLTILNYKKIVNDIEIDTLGSYGNTLKRYFEIFDADFNVIGYTGKRPTEKSPTKPYYTAFLNKFTAASAVGMDVFEYDNNHLVLKGIYPIDFFEEHYGFAVVKEYIDSTFLDSIKRLINREVILVIDNVISNSTIYYNDSIVKDVNIGETNYSVSKKINLGGKTLHFDFIPIVDYNKNSIAYIGVGFDITVIDDIFKKSIITFWQYLAIFTVLLLVSLVLLLNKIFKPFNSLSERIEGIAKGNYSEHIIKNTIPELEPFIKSIDNLTQKVKLREQSLRELNQQLEIKVEERTCELHRKNTELENNLIRLQETQMHLILSEKMASVGKLAAGIAHEINSPLSAVFTTSQLMKSDLSEIKDRETRESFNEYIEIIEESARKSRNIISRLFRTPLDLESYTETLNIVTIIKGIVTDFSNSGITSVKFILNHDDSLLIQGNLHDFKKCIVAILMNAKDAIEAANKTGVIEITAKCVNNYAVISIKDNGIGIDAEYLNKVFDPFFTTKDVGKGVGLSMTEVYEIIKKHNGSVDIESEKDLWTMVTMKIACKQ